MKTYANFTDAYIDLLKDVYISPDYESCPRGMNVKERLGHCFKILDIRNRIPYVVRREFSISYMIAELVWYLSANNKIDWIANYSSFWKVISDDGETANSAYGARIFAQHQYHTHNLIRPDWTQWEFLKEELQRDPHSRRAVVHIRLPQDSVLAERDVPCTLTLQFFIRNDALHQIVSMRSSDLILGIAYDVPAFTIFQEMLAMELNVRCGEYTHMSNSLHIYERHFKMVESILDDVRIDVQTMPTMPSFPPIDILTEYEKLFRQATSETQLIFIVNELSSSNIHQYWKDWLIILARHRAIKLSLDACAMKFVAMLSFSGYRLFNK